MCPGRHAGHEAGYAPAPYGYVRALAQAKDTGHACLVIDGALIAVDRVAVGRPFHSGKHRRHGMCPQVMADPGGDIVWVSGPLPGAVHSYDPPPSAPTPS